VQSIVTVATVAGGAAVGGSEDVRSGIAGAVRGGLHRVRNVDVIPLDAGSGGGEERRRAGVILVRAKEVEADNWRPIVERILAEGRPSLAEKFVSLLSSSSPSSFSSMSSSSNSSSSSSSSSRADNADILSLSAAEAGGMRNKVLIYVSRLINDRSSPTGALYAGLLAEFDRRYVALSPGSVSTTAANTAVSDAHAVIHAITDHVCATTAVGTSPAMRTHVAIAVDGLVLGAAYGAVFGDVRATASEKDLEMRSRVGKFKARNRDQLELLEPAISGAALHAYSMLEASRTCIDKLEWAVRMMESLSDGFGDADSLLKAVVTHVVRIQPADLFAQVMFCEEFVRDASACTGKMGYALVVMQAAAHFVADCDVAGLEANLLEGGKGGEEGS